MTGNALRRARAFLGHTQTEMAAAMGLSLATLQRREALAEEYVPLAEGTHARELTRAHALRVLDFADEAEQGKECISEGCSEHVPWNHGSDYCAKCIMEDAP